ncbi:MAG: hypothetical protein ACRDY7_08685 [Acidimicrobiia bacterium]
MADVAETVVLAVVAVALVVLVAGMARLISVLCETEMTLRLLVTGVRAAKQAAGEVVPVAERIGRVAAAGHDRLGVLDALKRAGQAGQ